MAGRDPIGDRVEVRLTPDMRTRVDALVAQARAERPKVSRAVIVRELLEKALSRR